MKEVINQEKKQDRCTSWRAGVISLVQEAKAHLQCQVPSPFPCKTLFSRELGCGCERSVSTGDQLVG